MTLLIAILQRVSSGSHCLFQVDNILYQTFWKILKSLILRRSFFGICEVLQFGRNASTLELIVPPLRSELLGEPLGGTSSQVVSVAGELSSTPSLLHSLSTTLSTEVAPPPCSSNGVLHSYVLDYWTFTATTSASQALVFWS